MNRTIKFRGKRTDNGDWVYGYYAVLGEKHCIYTGKKGLLQASPVHGVMYEDYKATEVQPETVGQFTGLLDSNGKEIYEGDILEYKDKKLRGGYCDITVRVFYCELTASFSIAGRILCQPEFMYKTRNYKVIGNIHDNGELINN